MSSSTNADSRADTIIGAVIGAIIQVVLTILLTTTIVPNIITAILIVLPVAIVTFLGVQYLYNRWQKSKMASSTAKQVKAKIDDDLIVVMEEMGISGGTTVLTKSKYEPLECMRIARRQLYFMGILGSKWVEPPVIEEFKKLLQRVQDRGGMVRFLLINPNGKAYQQLNSRRGIRAESLREFRVLRQDFPCLQVRLYDQMPCFRLVFIDDRLLALSRYKLDKEGYFQSRFGWEAPHLVINAEAPWSLYEAFELYFQQVWEMSQDL